VKYVGVDWAYRQAQWCAVLPGGEIVGEGRISADRDGLARLVLELGDEVKACLEMMSGALWVRDELVACGWEVKVADARSSPPTARPSSPCGHHPAVSWVGIGLAAFTAPTMPLLAGAKRRVGQALNSSATVSEAGQDMICAYLSIALLVGLLLNALAVVSAS
jgi:hypothetical protein